ncbi:hemerythrin domain-containing protein [Microbispora sp. H10885]|uniref:hemerythrin domain-containing protein n=1 Tax=Microbispora sp. H10885 TaxID=2729110 RepID=UPI001C71F0C6|nr:hemerythrin domain-containing protein [Microbispora sp. H10885]
MPRPLGQALAGPLGGGEATETVSREHSEIDRLARRIGTHVRVAGAAGRLRPEQLEDLRACLYGLHSVLRLHFVQEEEKYFSLAP